MNTPIEKVDTAIREAIAGAGGTVKDGPRENPANGVREWHVESPSGVACVVGVTNVALTDGADILGAVTGEEVVSSIVSATTPLLLYISSDLKVRTWDIEDADDAQ